MSRFEFQALWLLPRLIRRGESTTNCGRVPMAPDRQENDAQ